MIADQEAELAKVVDPFWREINGVFLEIWGERPFRVAKDDNELRLHTPDKFNLVKGSYRGESVFGDFEFILTLNSKQSGLSVQRSSFQFFTTDEREPLFRYEFDRSRDSKPRSYLAVHPRREGDTEELSNGRVRDIEIIEFPLGGDVLRPCLEDIILGLNNHFKLGITEDERLILKRRIDQFRENEMETVKSIP